MAKLLLGEQAEIILMPRNLAEASSPKTAVLLFRLAIKTEHSTLKIKNVKIKMENNSIKLKMMDSKFYILNCHFSF